MHLEVVTHCWRYATLLTYQLSSLVMHPPRNLRTTVSVFHATVDERTLSVLDFFQTMRIPNVDWHWRPLPRRRLLQRAIGRNEAALATAADWVWFADADMCFGKECLDRLCDQLTDGGDSLGPLVYPATVQISRTHALGDEAIARAAGPPRIIDIDPSEFQTKRYRRAIGGVQIARGTMLRTTGYCPRGRYQRPARRWRPCHSDRAFRRQLGTRGIPLSIPEVYRIRHSRRGRDHIDVEL